MSLHRHPEETAPSPARLAVLTMALCAVVLGTARQAAALELPTASAPETQSAEPVDGEARAQPSPRGPRLASLTSPGPEPLRPSLAGGAAPGPSAELTQRLRPPILIPAVEALGVQAIMMGWSRHVGEATWADVTPVSVDRNLRASWVLDDNAYFINQLGHPYQGTYAYTAARSAGLGFWGSSAYPFFASAAWELAGETEAPAINDQITTTAAGIVLGEVLFRMSDWIRGDGRSPWRLIGATLLAPMSSLNRSMGLGGPTETPTSVRVETQVGTLVAPGAIASTGQRVLGQPAPLLGLRVRQGLPGDEAFEFERPFDHFDLDAAIAATDQTFLSLQARGLVVGAQLGGPGDSGAALWGLWLGFDLQSPGARRVSTSTVGVGITGRQALGADVVLEGTAIGSAVLLGAAGLVARPDGSDKDYRMGPGTQVLLDTDLSVADRVYAGVQLRHVLVYGAGDQGGHDNLLDGTASGQVRLIGRHAFRVEVNRFLRVGQENSGASARAEGTLFAASWVYGDVARSASPVGL